MEDDDDPQQWDVFRRVSELEKSRKNLSDLVSRMDRFVQSEAKTLKGLFAPEMELYRLKLQETCSKLLEIDPSGWGLKAFDLCWRKGFYSSFKSAFKKEGGLDTEEKARVHGLLWRGVSHYMGVIGAIKGDYLAPYHVSFAKPPSNKSQEDEEEEWTCTVLYKSLLYLGDLTRYIRDISPHKAEYENISRSYYHQALQASKYQIGMPYNQLGRLSENNNNTFMGLQSAYYYLRSTCSPEAFEGAEINLKALLAKNEKVHAKLNEDKDDTTTCFVVSLLHMLRCVLFEPEMKTSELSEKCQGVLTFFYCRLVKEGEGGTPESGVSMNAVALLLAGFQFLEGKKETKPSFISLTKAALLALFSHCVFKLLVDLKMELFGTEDIEELEENIEEKREEEFQASPTHEQKKHSRNILDRFRRKRNRYTSSTDENESDEFLDEDDSCLSDEDGFSNSLSSDPDDYVLSDNFMNSSDSDEESIVDKSDEEEDPEEDVVIQQSSVVCSTKDLAKTLGNHSLASSIRLLCLWVMTSPEVVTETDEHSKIFWERLERVFALVDFPNSNKYIENEEVNENWDKIDAKAPMREDFYTKGLKMFSTYHSNNLDWKRGYQSLGQVDLGLVRIKQLLEFRSWLDEVKKSQVPDEKTIKEDAINSDEDKRHALMQSMAQLWLKQEVENLEEKDSKMFSPYIIVDHLAMVKHLRTIKDIVAAKKFTVIIPIAVVQELDAMKRTNNGARVAIRWLEWQFKGGNPWLRAQKEYESTALEDIKYPKRKNKEAWHYFEILECCNYFTRLGSTRTVTLLSPQDFQMDVNPTELAKLIGIRIEHVKTFRNCIKRNKERVVNS